jgi:2-C-methyl-D-erythritol 4-phosphate cytidylyltransferase
MREKAFGAEPASELLDPVEVARSSVDVLVSEITGQVVDVRRELA